MINSTVINLPIRTIAECEICGSNTLSVKYENQIFLYGDGHSPTELTACVPVWSCSACGDQFTDDVAEDLRHEAVCRHLNRLTPKEIKELRKRNNLTQEELANLTGIGIASIKRWEVGALIQGQSHDRFLRILENRDNIACLVAMDAPPNSSNTQHRFRTTLSPLQIQSAEVFVLRRREVPQELARKVG